MQWFRFFTNVINDPGIQALDGETFKAWVNLMCVAAENEGKLPDVEHIAYLLRQPTNAIETVLERLCERPSNAPLIARRNGGTNGYHYAISDWDKRRYKSDSSTERAQRSKQRSTQRSRTEQNRTEQKPPTPIDENQLDLEPEIVEPEGDDEGKDQPQRYAFEGNVVRLTQADYNRWATAFHGIPDIRAELMSIDAWFQGPEGKKAQGKWFHAASSMLNRKHQELLLKATAEKQAGSLQDVIRARHAREQAAKLKAR